MRDLRFYVFSTVFQSYQDDGRVIMKSCAPWNHVYDWKVLSLERGLNKGPLHQRARAQPTKLPGLLGTD